MQNISGAIEDQLTMRTLIYDKLDEISALLEALNSKLEKEKKDEPSETNSS